MARRQAGAEEASVAPDAAARKEPMREQTPRVDWAGMLRRTFDRDVFAFARCGGRRQVLAYLTLHIEAYRSWLREGGHGPGPGDEERDIVFWI